jgi:putative ubiquitin-RnfH superfamily antitoxin RatB of RatAB toxin-antitoxin module
MKVEVVRAWPHRCDSRHVELADGATVAEAIALSGIDCGGVAGLSVFGERVEPAHTLREGDRVELLGPLQADPKEARRHRAGTRSGQGRPASA